MKERGKWQGMISILRFNWPFYLAAGLVFFAALAGLSITAHGPLKAICGIAVAGAGYFMFVSLGVSHLIYDRSDLYRFRWLDRALRGARKESIIFCHSGLDESSAMLKRRLMAGEWVTLDHFDAEQMTEPSIKRARRLFPPSAETVEAPFDKWPVPSATADVVFGILAIHEFRSIPERTRWFQEARRSLKPGGRIVIAEHLRDTANLLAFGPGFLHFHSASNWQRSWENANLRATDNFGITPWIQVTILTPT